MTRSPDLSGGGRIVRGSLAVALWSLICCAETSGEIIECASDLFRDRVAAIVPSGSNVDEILRSALWIKEVDDPRLAALPVRVWEVQYTFVRPSTTAFLLVDAGRCELVGGDVGELLHRKLDWDQERRFALQSLNGFLKKSRFSLPNDETTVLRYGYAVVLVLYLDDQVQILQDEQSLNDLVAQTPVPGHASSKVSAERSAMAARVFQAPRVEYDGAMPVVEFMSWTKLGGALRRHRVSLLSDGSVTEKNETLVNEVGPYSRVRYRM